MGRWGWLQYRSVRVGAGRVLIAKSDEGLSLVSSGSIRLVVASPPC